MITGRACKLSVGGCTVAARTVIASDNLRSLMLEFDAAVHLKRGMYAGRIALLFDPDACTYRDLMTRERVKVDWLCPKCNEHFGGREVFKLTGERGVIAWDVEAARALVADPARRNPSPSGKPEVVPPELLDRFIEVNCEIVPEHLEHVDETEPGIVAQRFGAMFLLDGTHRAHKCKRDGKPFRAYVLTLEESQRLMHREMTTLSDNISAEDVARELRGVLTNNKGHGTFEAVLESDAGEDTVAAEAEIRKHLTPDENALIRVSFKPRER